MRNDVFCFVLLCLCLICELCLLVIKSTFMYASLVSLLRDDDIICIKWVTFLLGSLTKSIKEVRGVIWPTAVN